MDREMGMTFMCNQQKVLVLNAGSSSIKYRLYLMPSSRIMAQGSVERIHEEASIVRHKEFVDGMSESHEERCSVSDHKDALHRIMNLLGNPDLGVLHDLKEIGAVGHRVVHGGERFTGSILVDDQVIKTIEAHAILAPLHNPANLAGIKAAWEVLPHALQVAAFDTAFHHTLPEYAYRYALPEELYRQHGLRRYGFHGTSHRYVARRALKCLGSNREKTNLITAHLGNGCSMTAIREGHSVDTSMGFTPLEGLVMGTRCGDLDPAIPLFLINQLGMTAEEVDHILNKNSGLLALSGHSNDMREILQGEARCDARCKLALEIFTYRIKKYIGSYKAVLGQVHALIFTGGIGEHSSQVRAMICEGLDAIGMVLDDRLNRVESQSERDVSHKDSPTRIWVIPTDEESRIAVDTHEITMKWRRIEG